MRLTAPIIFEPIFMDRVWGGRRMESLFGKRLPTHGRIGEAWELVDRPEAQSVVHDGPLRGKTLHELWTQYRTDIFGNRIAPSDRFPLLFKLLDAQERLSVQVHPPAEIAPSLNGEPKTEMWYILDNYGDGDIFAGLKAGVTRDAFEQALRAGSVQDTVHRVPVAPGDCIFIPSGRIHAIGAGNVIVEVQQNSDTTYRIDDHGRLEGGKLRPLHVPQALETIRFDALMQGMPGLQPQRAVQAEGYRRAELASCEHFHVERVWVESQFRPRDEQGGFQILIAMKGQSRLEWRPSGSLTLGPGDTVLIPAGCASLLKPLAGESQVLWAKMP